LLGQLCEALQAAHAEGIVHRDLKPANLMVIDPDTPYEKIKVMDFGLAKLVESSAAKQSDNRVTDTGVDFAVGTPGYISPEQVRGEELDPRSDLYSVGVILFELLTGRLPFTRDETMDVLLAHATEPPPRFADVGASGWVAPEVELVVLDCLAKNPGERPKSARDLHERFEAALGRASEATHAANNPIPDLELEIGAPPTLDLARPKLDYDPDAIVHQMEAWMPDSMASLKLRGFVHDFDGEVLESVPGMIRVRLGGAPSNPNPASFSWFGFRKKSAIVDLELRLERNHATQKNVLHITVVMNPPDKKTGLNPEWRHRCNQIFCELRGYLAGSNVG